MTVERLQSKTEIDRITMDNFLGQIERLQARIELLDKVVDAASACIAAWDNAKWPSPIPLRKALAALKT